MAVLIVPRLDDEPWPTLGPQICDLLETYSIFGPGSLKGQPYQLDDEKRASIYRAYEVYPQWHEWAGRRRFKRVGYSVRKGLAKTEWAAQIAFAELHREGPVRCDGFDAHGEPVGRPVRDPYIPMLAVTVGQVEELAYGALYVLCTEGPDADMFDATLERIVRIGDRGTADGKAVPLSNSPGPRDGARTTCQVFDEPHRLVLRRAKAAHETMVANLEKRVLEDPWGLYVGTAGELGEGSIAEDLHTEAEMIDRGDITDPQLSYVHRDAGQVHDGSDRHVTEGHDLSQIDGRVAAIREATGAIGEYGPGQFVSIARQWDRPGADKSYLQRVWLNLWIKAGAQAFDVKRWSDLAVPDPIPDGAFVAAGFDGARFRDSTGIVLTDIATGRQQLWATWERPVDSEGRDVDEWEVPEAEVTEAWGQIRERFQLWKAYCDPPHWTETVGGWAAKWPDQFEEWWTTNTGRMARATRAYKEAILSGAVTHVRRETGRGNLEPAGENTDGVPVIHTLDAAFDRHIAAAGRRNVNMWDKDDQTGEEIRLFVLQKMHPDRKFDNAMAGCLSWTARLDALRSGAKPAPTGFVGFQRVR